MTCLLINLKLQLKQLKPFLFVLLYTRFNFVLVTNINYTGTIVNNSLQDYVYMHKTCGK